MSNNGYIKLYRQILKNPVVCKDSDHFAIWVYLLLNATHNNLDAMFNGKRITLNAGQLITGRKSISSELHIDESKVRRVLNLFEIDQQISRQRSNKNSLITILKWSLYQGSDQQNEQQVTNNRPTSDQQVTTNNNVKNVNNDKNEELKNKDYAQVVSYLNQKSNKNFRLTDSTKKLINARLNEGFKIDDFYRVIDNQCEKWLNDEKMIDYLRPQTLFSTKFESYLNTIKKKKFDIMDL